MTRATAATLPHDVVEGDLLWAPDADRIDDANVTAFTRWLRDQRGVEIGDDYHDLWRWSVTELDGFWRAIWDYFDVTASSAPTAVLANRDMPGATWFPGARLNYAQHALRRAAAGGDALLHCSETTPLTAMSWSDLAAQVRIVATQLRALGVGPGDRVVAWLPNIPEAVVAMLATTAIGAVWASCSPDFGTTGALDRFAQLDPAVLFAVRSYSYGGQVRDRTGAFEGIVAGLDELAAIVLVDAPGDDAPAPTGTIAWSDLLDHPPVPADGFAFAQVPFDHPLWILFSSGTTGLPKAIVHGHGGILLEQCKLQHLLMDLRAGDRLLFFTTTSWMMWNFVVSALLLGVRPLLYDGSPTHPAPDMLWRLVADAGVAFFGASPSYVDLMVRNDVVPRDRVDLSALRAVMPAGAPVSPAHTAWFYRNVAEDLWVATGSGGTDVCTGLVGGVPTLPVRAGEIQARSLGVDAHAFDDRGEPVIDQVGELVITSPMPSMPVRLWGDDDGERYRAAYFDRWPRVWRHGDFFRINERGGCFVLGRSDATLNRHGVRIGTAEIYRVLDAIDEVSDALVVNLDLPGGGFLMPLFVQLADGHQLDAELDGRIRARIRQEFTPRHVPDRIVAVPGIPRTRTGKRMEVPVRRILAGTPPETAANRSAMADPAVLDALLSVAADELSDVIAVPRPDPDTRQEPR